MSRRKCYCEACGMNGNDCFVRTKMLHHTADLIKLTPHSHQYVDLLVGSSKTRLTCSKLLLGFFSAFFHAALYGPFQEAENGEIKLPEETVEDVTAFINWVNTGNVHACHERLRLGVEADQIAFSGHMELSRLWVLGDKFLAPRFTNDVMYFFLERLRIRYIRADTVDYIWANTVEDSTLRLLARDTITSEGPLSPSLMAADEICDEWLALIRKGGDLVVECVLNGGFTNFDTRKHPWKPHHQSKYLRHDDAPGAEEWLVGKGIVEKAAETKAATPDKQKRGVASGNGVSTPGSRERKLGVAALVSGLRSIAL